MALQRATRVNGGGFLDLRELAREKPVVAVFRIREFETPERGDYGYILGVISDVLVCSGPSAGAVHLGERFIGAVTSTLRGVPNPDPKDKGARPQPPEVAVGAELVARVEVKNKGKQNEYTVLNEPSDADYAAAEEVYAGGDAWNTAAAPEPVAAGSGGGQRPF